MLGKLEELLRSCEKAVFYTQEFVITVERKSRNGNGKHHAGHTNGSENGQNNGNGKITPAQRRKIFAIASKLQGGIEGIKERYGIEHISELTKEEASELITALEVLEQGETLESYA